MSSTPDGASSRELRVNQLPRSTDAAPVDDLHGQTVTFHERRTPTARDVVHYFGDYELLEEIARGGMGVVFKARQITLNRIVAVKMILAGSFAGPEDVQRFYTEAEAAAQLDHPGIVPIYEVGQHEGQHYFSMGFVQGQSLAKHVAQGPFAPRAAAKMVLAVAKAVQYAHDKGIIHRDLKPANILLDAQGNPRVTDFGLAKLTESGSDLTGTGQVLGTPSYMSPEQAAAQSHTVGKLSDVYSLGAVLYCLLTGRPPFQAATPLETLYQVQRQEPVPPKQLNPSVPLDLNTIVLKCLEKSPNRRYDSAKALAEELQRYLEGRPILARPIGRVDRFARWCKREPVVASLSAAVAVALTAGAIVSSYYGVEASNRAKEKAELAESESKANAQAQENLRQAVITAVDAVQNNRGALVPPMFSTLKVLPRDMVAAELKSRYAKSKPDDRLGLAYALAEFGEVDTKFLCSQIKRSASGEVDNLAAALRHSSGASLQAIRDLAAKAESLGELARTAIIALHLGDVQIAAEMCRLDFGQHPAQRDAFIGEFSAWRGNDLTKLLAMREKLSDPGLCSAFCLALGSIPADEATSNEKAAWVPVLSQWYQTAPDSVTHSAAEWALRKWQVELPDPEIVRSNVKREWFINESRMTMLRIQPGGFLRPRDGDFTTPVPHVTLTKPFYLCDREVTRSQFEFFLYDDYPEEEKPLERDLYDREEYIAVDDEHPRDMVNWYDAILFCNWLSRWEGLTPCYERTGGKDRGIFQKVNGQFVECDAWRLTAGGTGYRLPTEAEWEYACRAGTWSDFSFGDNPELLRKYAHFIVEGSQGTAPCASKLPNGWGLFDVHGNLWEWCHDWYAAYGEGHQTDPIGPAEQPPMSVARIIRGGAWLNTAQYCTSGYRYSYPPNTRLGSIGFRVAMSAVQP